MSAEDPAVQGWQAATEQAASRSSTSSTARRLEAELEQTRRDYNAVILERAALADELTAARGRIVDLLYIIDAFQVESGADRNAAYQTGIEAVRQLRIENERLKDRPWIVARDGGRDCVRCEQEIRRGEAYEYLGIDLLEHIRCPVKEATSG